LGIGISLFIIGAPEQIRKFPSASDYIGEMEAVWSPSLVRARLDETITRFLNGRSEEGRHPVYGHSVPSFPDEPASHLHELIASLYRELPEDEFPSDRIQTEAQGTMAEATPYFFYSGSGNLMTDDIMEVMHSGRRVDMVFWSSMHHEALSRRKEVFFIDHNSVDYANFIFRIIVSSLFILGVALLLVPTITTSILVFQASFL
jgi:hypothetical protein